MNRQIARVFGLVLLMFALLIAFTSRWTVFEAGSLRANTANRRPLLEQQQIPRGLIFARDGTKLAVNQQVGSGQTKTYRRSYPTNSLFSHAVGYSYVSRGDSGLEKSQNDVLSGNGGDLRSFLDSLGGGRKEGLDLRTTLDPQGQRAALAALGGKRGSIVAIEPSTGAVRVMASMPDYDPNRVPQEYARLNTDAAAPIFDRATQARYPPGSTFKVVTAAAALDTGRYTPDSQVNGSFSKVISGVPLQNFSRNEDFPSISLTDALTKSVNTVFAQVGVNLGRNTMQRYMQRFGFNANPTLDYPAAQMTPSGEFKGGRLLPETSPQVDLGRMAIGQDKLQVTPLQMAEVAGAVGNHGVLMKPRLVDRVIAPDGRVRTSFPPREQATVMSPRAAGALATMMGNVVQSGTGTAAALQGIQVAGKTGTAQVGGGLTQAWFIAFAPLSHPRIAVAVTIERTSQSLTGGEVAAPLAAKVMQVLLGEHG
ncbi:MAG: penicillin-binding transpeptidase domain-containing protein [Thermoleophilaceae bacterium]